jgi:hypothetical protein
VTRPQVSFRQVRDPLLFLTGLGLTVHEAVFYSGPERVGLMFLFAGMMGLPAFLRADERRADTPDESSKEHAA